MAKTKKMKGEDPCWDTHKMVGTKTKGGKEVPNCVPKEEFESWVEELWNEGYDLSNWTWEGLFEYYLNERKYEPDEKLPSGKTPNEKMERAQQKHGANYILSRGGGRYNPSRDSHMSRGKKVKKIQDIINSGEDPRNSPQAGVGWGNDARKIGRPGVSTADRTSRTKRTDDDDARSTYTQGGLRAHKTKAGGYRTLVKKEELEMQEAWYSGKGTYRTTASGRRVRWDEDDAVDNAVSDMIQKRGEEAKKKAARAKLKAKGKVPTKGGKPMFEAIVEHLFVEGYADTIESAEIMAGSISEDWATEILEGYKDFPTHKVMKKAGELMGSSDKKKTKRGTKMMDVMMQHSPDR